MIEAHCPYCALQCGMSLRHVSPRDGDGAARGRGEELPREPGRAAPKGWIAAGLLRSGERLVTPPARPRRGAPLPLVAGTRRWDEALDRVAAEIGRLQRAYGNDAAGMFGGGADQREGVLAGRVRPRRAAHSETSTKTAGYACRRRPARRRGRSAPTTGCRSRWPIWPRPPDRLHARARPVAAGTGGPGRVLVGDDPPGALVAGPQWVRAAMSRRNPARRPAMTTDVRPSEPGSAQVRH
jgi:hypothetical protein